MRWIKPGPRKRKRRAIEGRLARGRRLRAAHDAAMSFLRAEIGGRVGRYSWKCWSTRGADWRKHSGAVRLGWQHQDGRLSR